MTRYTQECIRAAKLEAKTLATFANIKSKEKATREEVLEILIRHIPYRGDKPEIVTFSVTYYSKNDLLKTARFNVWLTDGRVFEITAYQKLKGRTKEQREEDKTAHFPSGLFTVFHTDITPA